MIYYILFLTLFQSMSVPVVNYFTEPFQIDSGLEKGVSTHSNSCVDPIVGEMIYIEGGSFRMGSKNEGDEQPIHTVEVQSFFIGKYEVTQQLWKSIMGKNPSAFKQCEQCPVETISWDDAQEFIKNLNQKSAYTYRLPTETEWEYAAGGGRLQRSNYAGTDEDTLLHKYGNFCDTVCAYSYAVKGQKDDYEFTAPVGTYAANSLGLHDMSGNVWEWCQDWYHDSYLGAPKDGSGWFDPMGTHRVIRGGSWTNDPAGLRVASRGYSPPHVRSSNIGLRLARNRDKP